MSPSGKEMTDQAWDAAYMRCLGVRLAGEMSDEIDNEGNPIIGDTLFFALNAHHEAITFQLPGYQKNERWMRVLDTAAEDWGKRYKLRSRSYPLQERSMVVFQLLKPDARRNPWIAAGDGCAHALAVSSCARACRTTGNRNSGALAGVPKERYSYGDDKYGPIE